MALTYAEMSLLNKHWSLTCTLWIPENNHLLHCKLQHQCYANLLAQAQEKSGDFIADLRTAEGTTISILFLYFMSLELTAGLFSWIFFSFISPQKEMFVSKRKENLLISYVSPGHTDELDYSNQGEYHSIHHSQRKKTG